MFVKATAEDNFYVERELKPHLHPYAFQDTRVVRKILKSGITKEFAHLDLPKFKRGEERDLMNMILAKESHFLVLPGETDCVNPERDWAEWDKKHADFRESAERIKGKSGAGQTPPFDQASTIEPKTPAFEVPEIQVISTEKKFSSPTDSDFNTPTSSGTDERYPWYDAIPPASEQISPELYCTPGCGEVWYDCTCPDRIPYPESTEF